MIYVYLLKSLLKKDEIYLGSTNNLRKRFVEHNLGKVVSTRRYKPWRLLYYEAYPTESLARMREKRLKYNGNAIRELKKRIGLVFKDKSGRGLSSTTFDPDSYYHHNKPISSDVDSKKPWHHKSGAGFTLIEVIVYLALFAILFGGAIAAAYNVIESSGRNQSKANLQEEGEFLVAKINWALSGVQSVTIPAVGSENSQLSVSKVTGLYNGQPVIVYLSVRLDGTNMVIDKGSGPVISVVLNNSNTYVSQLVFTHASASGQGINPESVAARFVLSAKTPGGMDMSQEFSTTAFLRK